MKVKGLRKLFLGVWLVAGGSRRASEWLVWARFRAEPGLVGFAVARYLRSRERSLVLPRLI